VEVKALNLLTGLKDEVFPLLSEPLQSRPVDTITADVRRGDRLPCQLCRSLVGEGGTELDGDGSTQCLQGSAVDVIADTADMDRLLEMPSLQLYLLPKAPLVVV
jgi:hypothetical protein